MEQERSAFTCRVSDDITTLSVMIGEGQLGATFVFRGDDILVQGGIAIGQLNLGPGIALVGTKISVESLVNDVVSESNRMSVRYVVRNGASETVFVASHDVSLHVLEIMDSILRSAASGQRIDLEHQCARPAAMRDDLPFGQLD